MSAPRLAYPSDPSGAVSDEWIAKSIPLADAIRAHSAPEDVGDCDLWAERFKELGEGETVESVRIGARSDGEIAERLTGEQLTAWRMFVGRERMLSLALENRLWFCALVAFGSPAQPWAPPEWIASARWQNLTIDPRRRDVASGEGGGFFNVRVLLAQAVLGQGATVAAPVGAAVQAQFSPEALSAWFLFRVKTWPTGAPLPSAEKDKAAAEAMFGKIPRALLRSIRAKKTPPMWRKQGKRGGFGGFGSEKEAEYLGF